MLNRRVCDRSVRKAIDLKPNAAEAHAALGLILYGNDDHQSAIAECREAIALKPDYFQAHYCLALALHAVGGDMEAEQELQEAYRMAHKQPQN